MEIGERQEGAEETTNSDTINPPFIKSSPLNVNNVSHSINNIDKIFQNISLGQIFSAE